MTQIKPIVAIVGRPNVGKSRMFNRFVRQERSIVLDQPGVTRDRIYADAVLRGPVHDRPVIVVDTGGFDPSTEDPVIRRVVDSTQLAIDEADVIVFLTDGRVGVLPEDEDIAAMLRKSEKPTVLAVNKLDGPKQDDLLHEFHRLGLEPVLAVSGAHGRNVGDLEELIFLRLPPETEASELEPELAPEFAPEFESEPVSAAAFEADSSSEALDEAEAAQRAASSEALDALPSRLRIAVIGRPNAGKSSLVNRLLGEDRHVVSDVAGTTVDSVDSLLVVDGESYLFIDTAGIRRRRSIAMRMERFSVMAALKGLERSDVALLMLDATEEIAKQDAKVSAFAYERGKAVVKVVSKWDAAKMSQAAFLDKLKEALPHLDYAPTVFTSAHTGEGLSRLFGVIRRVAKAYRHRVSTSELNRFVGALTESKAPPSKKGRHGRIYYLTQIGVCPPRFWVSVNDPELFHFAYRRFLVNELRKAYGYQGVPLLIGYRSHAKKAEAPKREEAGKLKASQHPSKQATARKRLRKANKRLNRKPRKTSIKRLSGGPTRS